MQDDLSSPQVGLAERDRIGVVQVDVLHSNARVGVTGAAVALFVTSALLVRLGAITLEGALVWSGICCLICTAHFAEGRRWRRRPDRERAWRPAAWRFTACSLAEGLLWGVGLVMLLGPGDVDPQLLLLGEVLGVASGAVVAFGSYLPAALVFLLPATLPFLARASIHGGPLLRSAAVLLVLFIASMVGLAIRHNAAFLNTVRLRFANQDLAERLREQRDRAERANAEKSRFLAAASHDLRQPVHALSMLTEAFTRRDMTQANLRVLELTQQSVAALDGLFDALLDISRLDAGLIAVRRQGFDIGPMLGRLCAEHRPQAEAKGLRLALCPCAAIVDTDPVLLERILRNLLDNAVRYTDQGRILVGCRRQAGHLSVQVWDTGRGIPAAEQARVFEEFHQLDNPERDRAKGLGLGLAIVRRLAGLLDHPIELRSQAGRGSSFRVRVPFGAGMPEPQSAPLAIAHHDAVGLVLVVDDEAAIREATRLLLSRWGHTVLAAASCDEMLAMLAAEPVRPGAILCDYRLRGHENGIEAIARLRASCGPGLPAILMTGDTGPDRLAEAAASGLMLLHKPVAPSRLRAALAAIRAAEHSVTPATLSAPVRPPASVA